MTNYLHHVTPFIFVKLPHAATMTKIIREEISRKIEERCFVMTRQEFRE